MRGTLACILALALLSACTFPRDPEETLQGVESKGVLRVGVVENRPWLERDGEVAGGVEAELIEAFARSLDAEVEWNWGSAQEHLEALAEFELDVVAGGFMRGGSLGRHVALSKPYYMERIVVGLPPGRPPLVTIEGLPIAVERGSVLVANLRERDAVPLENIELKGSDGPVAAASWQLEAWGFSATTFELHERGRVLAAPPGENRFLITLERFLESRETSIHERLVKAVRP